MAKEKIKYLQSKERTKENINNKNIKNIRQDLERQHSQEIMRFFNFCDRELENYLKSIIDEIKDYHNIIQHHIN
ncbi:MAG: hypothetical protein AAF383_23965 [Cyanobacteria bacterium P01_A01_bin.83]